MRIASIAELEQDLYICDLIECHKQVWKKKKAWLAYEDTPRAADGFMIVCSKVVATFRLKDGRTVTASEGDIVYAPKGSRYTVTFENGGASPDLYTVNFCLRSRDGEELRLSDAVTVFAKSASSECRCLAEELSLSAISPRPNRLRQHALLLELIAAISDLDSRLPDIHPMIREGARLLAAEWNRNAPIERYAEVSRISIGAFYRYFKEWAGVSPIEYRTGMRISAARSFLLHSALSVSEIAEQVGYEDPFYFSRVFRKETGLSPQQFRKGNRLP